MVKNELSIKASETKRVATNMQNVQFKKVTSKISKELAKLHQQLSFNTKENEVKLHELRLKHFEDEVSLIHNENPYAALKLLYTNIQKNVKNVGILIYVEILSGDVVNDVIPSIAKSTNFLFSSHPLKLVKLFAKKLIFWKIA